MTTLYRVLLRLYPASFYHRFAREMAADYTDGFCKARGASLLTGIEFAMRAYGDLFTSVVAQWHRSESYLLWRAAVLIALIFWGLVFAIAALEWPNGPGTTSFAVQLSLALTTCAALTIGLALHGTRRS